MSDCNNVVIKGDSSQVKVHSDETNKISVRTRSTPKVRLKAYDKLININPGADKVRVTPSVRPKITVTSVVTGGGGTVDPYIPLNAFSNLTYAYFVGAYNAQFKVNRYDDENTKESEFTETEPTTIEECEALFD